MVNFEYNNDSEILKRYFKEIGKFKPMTREYEHNLLIRAKSGDNNARNEIVKRHLRLVVKEAHKIRHLGGSFTDLISEGNIGLMKAVEKFDIRMDVEFYRYAGFRVRREMYLWLHNNGRMVRLPKGVVDSLIKTKQELLKNGGDDGYVAKYNINLLEDNILVSKCEFIDTVADNRLTIDTTTPFVEKDITKTLNTALNKLKPRDRDVIVSCYGLGDRSVKETLDSIGKRYGVSKQSVKQLRDRILVKIKDNNPELADLLG